MKVDRLVPEIYYRESRDFSYIGRLFEIIFNYMKTGADLVKINTENENINSNIIDLEAKSLGFQTKHEYITKDLVAIISAFSELINNKGTLAAIAETIRLLCTSQNLTAQYATVYTTPQKTELLIMVPTELKDTVLMEDLFEYILPAGVAYTLVKTDFDKKTKTDILTIANEWTVKKYSNTELGHVYGAGEDPEKRNAWWPSGIIVTEAGE